MFDLLLNSDLVFNITSLVINSVLPGLGIFVLLILGKRLLKQFNAATQYAVTFSALVVLVCAVLFVPALSFIQVAPPQTGEIEQSEGVVDEAQSPRSIVELPDEGASDGASSQSDENSVGLAEPRETYSAKPLGPANEMAADENSGDDKSAINANNDEASAPVALNADQEATPPAPLGILTGVLTALKFELPGNWVPVIFMLWALGVGVMTARLLYSYSYLIRLKRQARVPSSHELRILNALQANAGIERRARFLISNNIAVPVVAGLTNPAILLPDHLIEHLSKAELEEVVLHELAHLKRFDDWGKLTQHLLQIPLYFHPAIWWMSRTLDFNREVACDDWLIAQRRVERQHYSESLCKVAEWSLFRRSPIASSTLGMAASPSQIEKRIKLLLDKKREVFSGVRMGRWALFSVGLIAAAGLMMFAVPNIGIAEVVQDEEIVEGAPSAVMYKHRVYKPATIEEKVRVTLYAPQESKDWWDNRASVRIPEAPELEIEGHGIFVIDKSASPEAELFRPSADAQELNLNVIGSSPGLYEFSKIEVIDRNDNVWEVPIGTVVIDIRDEAPRSHVDGLFECSIDQIVQSSTTDSDQSQFELMQDYAIKLDPDRSIDPWVPGSPTQAQSGIQVIVHNILWGEGLFSSNLSQAESSLTSGLTGIPSAGEPVELPGEINVREEWQFDLSFADEFENDRSIFATAPMIAYEYVKEPIVGKIFYEQLNCWPDMDVNYVDREIEAFQPTLISAPNAASANSAAPEGMLQVDPETGEVLAVAYRNFIYSPMRVGDSSRLGIQIPSRAQSWWDGIESIQFPEISAVTVIEFHPTLPLSLVAEFAEPGIYTATRIHAMDGDGQRWEIPIGEIHFDVRTTDEIAQQAQLTDRCDLWTGEPHSNNIERSDAIYESFFGASQNSNVEILRLQWGDELFSNSEGELAYELMAHPADGSGEPESIELPYVLTDESVVEFRLDLAQEPNAAIPDEQQDVDPSGFYHTQLLVTYRDLSESGEPGAEITELAPACWSTRSVTGIRDYVNAVPLSGPESEAANAASAQSVVQSTNSSAVMYKHRVYQPMNKGVEGELYLSIPTASRDWWENVDELSFDGAPHITITDFDYRIGSTLGVGWAGPESWPSRSFLKSLESLLPRP